jgi:GDP-D-mannose dehydratase
MASGGGVTAGRELDPGWPMQGGPSWRPSPVRGDSTVGCAVMMRMLVTGGAGFIGANFVHYTVRNHVEYRVRVLDALTYAGDRVTLRSAADQIEFVEGDICDHAPVDRLVAEADVVVHFAAESHIDNSLHDPEPFIRSNVLGTYSGAVALCEAGAGGIVDPSWSDRQGQLVEGGQDPEVTAVPRS